MTSTWKFPRNVDPQGEVVNVRLVVAWCQNLNLQNFVILVKLLSALKKHLELPLLTKPETI